MPAALQHEHRNVVTKMPGNWHGLDDNHRSEANTAVCPGLPAATARAVTRPGGQANCTHNASMTAAAH